MDFDPIDAEDFDVLKECVEQGTCDAMAAPLGFDPKFIDARDGIDGEESRLTFEDGGGVSDDGVLSDGDECEIALIGEELLPNASHFPSVFSWVTSDFGKRVIVGFDLSRIEVLNGFEFVDAHSSHENLVHRNCLISS